MSTKGVPNEQAYVRFGPQPVDFIADSDVVIGVANNDTDHVIALEALVLFTNVAGVISVAPIATIDNATTGETIATSTTFTSGATDKFTTMVIPANAYQVTGDADTNYFRLHITTKAVGQATTFRARSNNVATLTLDAPHGIVAGTEVTVSGVTGAAYNGRVTVISAPTTTTISYYSEGDDESSTADTGGLVGAFDAQVIVNALYLGDLLPS